MTSLNVDQMKQNDRMYRYKMPAVIIKVEGSGIGIKTVIVNIAEISGRLQRKIDYVMKFLSISLNTRCSLEDEKWLLKGEFLQKDVQHNIFQFINRFVLCKNCRNPETSLFVGETTHGKKKVVTPMLQCQACSFVTEIDPNEQLSRLIVKEEQPRSVQVSKKDKKKKKKEKTKDEEQAEAWAAETRAATEADASGLERKNPVEVLKEFLPTSTGEDLYAKIQDIRLDYNLSEKDLVRLVFEAVFTDEIIKNNEIDKYGKLLNRFLKDGQQHRILIDELMAFCLERKDKGGDVGALYRQFPILLKKFFDADLLTEEAILTWHSGKVVKQKSLPKDEVKAFKTAAKPVVDWLQADDSEEEEGEEDGDEDES